ncbi:MAG: hypothetical protein HZA90_11125 [Verrucomicrobia bacterium]|nr:hypothetical protein [Verrucomicrobiota bacterium]
MSMGASKQRLTGMTRELLLKWDQTKEHWQDAKSREFEQKYITELVAGVDKAVAVIEQLDKLAAKIRSDCE